jgi:hypothetical protein
MNKFVVTLLIVCGVFAGSVRQASAQGGTWADRGYVNIGWGVESGSSAMTDSRTGTVYEETATVTSSGTFSSGSLFDVGVGVRVFRNFTVGASYHQEQNDTEGRLTGSIPSPVIFNRPRNLDQGVPGLERKEKAVHLQFGWAVPINEKFDVLVYAGPSFFRMEQDVVSDVSFGEGNNNTVIATPSIATRKKSKTGYNVGADATYIVWQNDSVRVGAGGFVRFTQASMDIEMLNGGTPQSTDAGGVQFGFGARLRF